MMTANPIDNISLLGKSVESEQDIVRLFQRDLNVLKDQASNRMMKRKVLDKLRAYVEEQGIEKTEFDAFFYNHLLKILVLVLEDAFEKCRELSSSLLLFILNRPLTSPELVLQYTIPELKNRIGEAGLKEPSEEIRLILIKITGQLCSKSGDAIVPYNQDIISILRNCLLDPFPEVKKEACQLLAHVCQVMPKAMEYHGPEISKLLIPCLVHRHSSVRIFGIQALISTIMINVEALDDMNKYVYALSRDQSPAVREELYKAAAAWSLNLPDRYSVGYKILPLLLSGHLDDIKENRHKVQQHFHEIGELYEREWIDRVKAELDLVPMSGQSFDEVRIGARHAIQDHTMKIVDRTLLMLQSWSVEERMQGIHIFYALISTIKGHITAHVSKLIAALCRIYATEEPSFVSQVDRMCMEIGKTVEPETWMICVENEFRLTDGSNSVLRHGILLTLQALLKGTLPVIFVEKTASSAVCRLLYQTDFLSFDNEKVLQIVFSCVSVMAGHLNASLACPKLISASDRVKELFDLAVKLKCAPLFADDKMTSVMALLSSCGGFSTVQEMVTFYMQTYFEQFLQEYESWTKFSYEPKLLAVLCIDAGDGLSRHLECKELFFGLIEKLTQDEVDADIKMRLFSTIELESAHINAVLTKILVPNLVWRAGKKYVKVRSLCIACLLQMLPKVKEMDAVLGHEVIRVAVGLIDENELETRRACVMVLEGLFAHHSHIFNGEMVRLVYPEIIKRMDDAQNDMRVLAAHAFSSMINCLQANGLQQRQDERLSEDVWKWILESMVLHMDDTDPLIQEAVCGALSTLTAKDCVPKPLLNTILENARLKHRSPLYLQRIISLLKKEFSS